MIAHVEFAKEKCHSKEVGQDKVWLDIKSHLDEQKVEELEKQQLWLMIMQKMLE